MINISTLYLATMMNYFIISNYVFSGFLKVISLHKIVQIKVVLYFPSWCDRLVSFIWLIALVINSSTMLNRTDRIGCTFLDLGPHLKGKVFRRPVWAQAIQRSQNEQGKMGPQSHPLKDRTWAKESVFFNDLAPTRSPCSRERPHISDGQCKLDLMV